MMDMVQRGDMLDHILFAIAAGMLAISWGKRENIMTSFRKIALGAATAAMLSASATPAMAASFYSVTKASAASGDMQSASDYRRRYRHHRDRVDAGDVIAGIDILAGIAIIAGAASKAKNDKRRTSGERYPEPYPDSYPNRDTQDTRPYSTPPVPNGSASGDYSAGNDLGAAVDACTRAAEQSAGGNARVEEIRSVTREGNGWQVLGRLNGTARGFSCVASNGVVDSVRLDDGRDI
jgi:hypothetical protein